MAFLGHWLDNRFKNEIPGFTLSLSLLAVFAILYKLSFPVKLLLLSISIAVLVKLTLTYLPNYNPGTFVWYALIFFTLLTYVIYMIASMGVNRGNKTFIYTAFGTMIIRLLASVFFIIIYLLVNQEKNLSFIVSFLSFYLFFTIFEIYHLVRKLRPEKSGGLDSTSN
jgi:hypothetical protein